jgi:hypothetical protein
MAGKTVDVHICHMRRRQLVRKWIVKREYDEECGS